MITTLSPLPEQVQKWIRKKSCQMIHEQKPIWDGDYKNCNVTGKQVPNIRYVCDKCGEFDK